MLNVLKGIGKFLEKSGIGMSKGAKGGVNSIKKWFTQDIRNIKSNISNSSWDINKEGVVRLAKGVGSLPGRVSKSSAGQFTKRNVARMKPSPKTSNIVKSAAKKVGVGGFALGGVAMLGYNVMNGGMSQARETMQERYLQDYTYSRNMLGNSRVGLASGTASMLKNDGTVGLSNALSKTRHGKY